MFVLYQSAKQVQQAGQGQSGFWAVEIVVVYLYSQLRQLDLTDAVYHRGMPNYCVILLRTVSQPKKTLARCLQAGI